MDNKGYIDLSIIDWDSAYSTEPIPIAEKPFESKVGYSFNGGVIEIDINSIDEIPKGDYRCNVVIFADDGTEYWLKGAKLTKV